MDKHLNLFYCYAQGSVSTAEKSKQLEDNITRAFIVMLRNLTKANQKGVIKELIGESKSDYYSYDLQNTSEKKQEMKYILVFQRYDDDKLFNELKKLGSNKSISLENKDINRLKIAMKKQISFQFEGRNYEYSELQSIYDINHSSRADGWILGNEETILVESKIGDAKVTPEQIYRHIKDKNGFNSSIDNVNKKIMTWQKLYELLNKKDNISNERDKFIINQFKEYLVMTGQVLDLSYIIEGDISKEQHKEQFKLFKEKFDAEIKNEFEEKISPENRSLLGLWQGYKINNDSHFSLYFNEKSISFAYTISSRKRTPVSNKINKINDLIENIKIDNSYLERLYITFEEYRLVDKGKGFQTSEKYSPLLFTFRLSELNKIPRNNSGKEIKEFLEVIYNTIDFKQFEIGISIDFFDFNKIFEKDELGLKKSNRDLLKKPGELIKLFIKFAKYFINPQ